LRSVLQQMIFERTDTIIAHNLTLRLDPMHVWFRAHEDAEIRLPKGETRPDRHAGIESRERNGQVVRQRLQSLVPAGADIKRVSVTAIETGFTYVLTDDSSDGSSDDSSDGSCDDSTDDPTYISILVQFDTDVYNTFFPTDEDHQNNLKSILPKNWAPIPVFWNELTLSFDGVILERVMSKRKEAGFLLKGEGCMFAVRPEVAGAEDEQLLALPIMFIPGSDDYENMLAHFEASNMRDQLESVSDSPFYFESPRFSSPICVRFGRIRPASNTHTPTNRARARTHRQHTHTYTRLHTHTGRRTRGRGGLSRTRARARAHAQFGFQGVVRTGESSKHRDARHKFKITQACGCPTRKVLRARLALAAHSTPGPRILSRTPPSMTSLCQRARQASSTNRGRSSATLTSSQPTQHRRSSWDSTPSTSAWASFLSTSRGCGRASATPAPKRRR
jgi:hypothetical protein